MAGCDDGAATKRYVFSSGHQANLKMSTKTSVTLWCILYFIQRFFGVISLIRCCPTCQGYSLTSVSTLPTILVRLRATPQFHVEEEVAGVVDPEIGLEVVVEIVVIVLGAEIREFVIEMKNEGTLTCSMLM